MTPPDRGAGARLLTGTMARAMEITTPLGPDVLLFHRMRARDELSRLSTWQASLLSQHDIEFDELLGMRVSIRVGLRNGDGVREFNGHVTRIAQHGTLGRYHRYTTTISPWLWFLTRTSDCRVFSDMTVREIVDAVFADHEADHEWALTGEYPRWEYCVQYRETDFNFVSRLLEQEGIYYYFRHVEGRAVMVLTDSSSQHEASAGAGLPFIPPNRLGSGNDVEHVSAWRLSRQVQPGAYAHRDYDFERPNVDLSTRATAPRRHEQSRHERFDYPGGYVHRRDGERYAALRIDQYSRRFETARAETNARGVAVGYRMTLRRHPREDQNREYLVTSATHELEFSDYEALPERGRTAYRCRFSTLPSERQFRPRRLTKKPFVQGLQTAVVVGPADQEIHTDALGRVKVQFHWDRYGTRDERSSCWVRVSQFWAGHHFGAQFIPRVGYEVVVDFLEGDPDRPIVIGCVYNGAVRPPFDLPRHKTQSGVKTRSTPNGTATDGNMIRFEDKKGDEELYLHAERTMTVRVEGSESHSTAGSRNLVVGGGQNTAVTKDHNVEVSEGAYNIAVRQQHMLIDVPNDRFHVCGKNIWHVADDELLSTVHDSSLLMDRTSMYLSGTSEIVTEVVGNVVHVGTASISLTAIGRITLSCGPSKIELTPAGIEISSPGPVDMKGVPIKFNS
jgi:type VI secretion system secreted protein VgrG